MTYRVRMAALVAAAQCMIAIAAAQQPQPLPDNTKTNQRDRNSSEPTADQAKNDAGDRAVMQKIRKSVMDDKSLSTYAHNVKIVARNGKVTLIGPVRSQQEEDSILQKATAVAGAENVTDQITVQPEKRKD
jgi:hyperosmotically inducible protein